MTHKKMIQKNYSSTKPVELWLRQKDIPLSEQKNLDEQRFSAWNKYLTLPVPTRADEKWRHVDLTKLPFELINKVNAAGKLNKTEVAVEGSESLRSKGVIFDKLKDAERLHPDLIQIAVEKLIDPSQGKFAALVAAQANTGALIYVPSKMNIEQPFRITLSGSGDTLGLFNLMIWLEADSKATVIVNNSVKDTKNSTQLNIGNIGLHLGENATLTMVELQPDGKNCWNILYEKAWIGQAATLEWIVCSTGSKFTKDFIQVDLAQTGATATVAGLYLTSGDQQVEFETRQNHLSPNSKSDLLFKGVLLEESRTLFRGMIHVSPQAIKTDGYQANRNLILGSGAQADSIPGLEILADDVRCSHGATIGKIDPEELFYLQSRGLDMRDARKLIVQGFLDPIVQKIPSEIERAVVQHNIDKKLTN